MLKETTRSLDASIKVTNVTSLRITRFTGSLFRLPVLTVVSWCRAQPPNRLFSALTDRRGRAGATNVVNQKLKCFGKMDASVAAREKGAQQRKICPSGDPEVMARNRTDISQNGFV